MQFRFQNVPADKKHLINYARIVIDKLNERDPRAIYLVAEVARRMNKCEHEIQTHIYDLARGILHGKNEWM